MMELNVIRTKPGGTEYILLDQDMRIVKPVMDYLQYIRLRGRSENTVKAYAFDLKVFFGFMEVNKLGYESIGISAIKDYIEYLRNPNTADNSLFVESVRTPKTINRMLGTVHGFYCYQAMMQGIDNPIFLKDINSPNSIFKSILIHTRKNNYIKQSVFKVKESDYRIHLIKDDEAKALLEVLPTHRDKLIFKILLLTGARIGEVLELRIEDIPIPDSLEPVSVIRDIVSKGGRRDLYIATELLEELDAFIIKERSCIHTIHSFVFVSQQPKYLGRPLTYRGIYEVFKRTGKKLGLDFKFHDARHTFITKLVEYGMDISVVKVIAGHKHITTTQQYVTLSSNYLAQSLSKYWSNTSLMGGGFDAK